MASRFIPAIARRSAFSVAPRASRPAALQLRPFTKASLILNEDGSEYDKHRVKVDEPTSGTTQNIVIPAPTSVPISSEPDLAYQSGQTSHARRGLKSFSMEGKVCVVTGGARGIGQMFARTLVEAGATEVVILDLKKEDAQEAAREMEEYFETENIVSKGELKVTGFACDVASEESVQAAFDAALTKYGKIDVAVNCAGIVENFPAEDYPTNKLKKLVDINIMGSYFVAREAAKRMQKGSSIVLVGSMSGLVINVPQPQSPYNMSKAAVIHMAKSLAVEWAPKGIRVNAISPGYVLTNLTKVILDANHELRDTWVNMTPMGRLADPQDLKGAIVYLASDASAFTTGSNMVIDGGYTCT